MVIQYKQSPSIAAVCLKIKHTRFGLMLMELIDACRIYCPAGWSSGVKVSAFRKIRY
jgi:hypothetical protein